MNRDALEQILDLLDNSEQYAAKLAAFNTAQQGAEKALADLAIGEELVAARQQAFNDRESTRIERARSRDEMAQELDAGRDALRVARAALTAEQADLHQCQAAHEKATRAIEVSTARWREDVERREAIAIDRGVAADATLARAEKALAEANAKIQKLTRALADIN